MHSLQTIQEVDRLLRLGELSHRAIARRVGCSRGVVDQLASGKRGLYGAGDEEDQPRGKFRCPGCGGLVESPCVRCRTELFLAKTRGRRREAA